MEFIEKHSLEFNKYYNLLIEENKKYNLTNITEQNEAYIKHFYDSIALKDVLNLDEVETLLDVGSGAGFPSIPLKICFPHLKITIIEPTLKRVKFLQMVVDMLDLKDVTIINKRCEDVYKDYVEKFDVTTARAVAQCNILLELLVSFSKVNQKIILYKSKNIEEELKNASNAINKLNIKINKIYNYELPNQFGSRCLVEFIKLGKTPSNYPRRYKDIKERPL